MAEILGAATEAAVVVNALMTVNGTAHGWHDEEEEETHAHLAILFLFVALAMGGITMHFLSRYMPSLPYTVVLLVEGFIVGGWHANFKASLVFEPFAESLDMWSAIHPHLLLFTFLPALLFADSMGLNWHLWKRCLGQCLVLAGPGVLIGTALTACVGRYVFPYGWSWTECAMFGSILSATDPVAVVAILKELGAPDQLTMCVTGESLLNDGTAIVLFNLFSALTFGSKQALKNIGASPEGQITMWATFQYFCYMAVGGICVGAVFGCIAVFWIGKAKRKTNHQDELIQIVVTICLAYLSFFVAEFFLGVSGVLAVVSAALIMAAEGWPHFANRESMGCVWHMIEHIGNTIIFFLAGVILGGQFSKEYWMDHFVLVDRLLMLFLLYFSCIAIRAFMVMLLYPILSRLGYGFTIKDAIVLSWGGLRGALGLALALDVDLSYEEHNEHLGVKGHPESTAGSEMLFHVGGFALLTLMINGVSSGALLKFLGMTKSDKYEEVLLHDVNRRIQHRCQEVFMKEAEELDLNQEQREFVRCSVSALKRHGRHGASAESMNDDLDRADSEESHPPVMRSTLTLSKKGGRSAVVRQVFLAMLRSKYVEFIDRGVLRAHGQASRVLNSSVDLGMEVAINELADWKAVVRQCQSKGQWQSSLEWISRWLPSCFGLASLMRKFGLTIQQRTVCYLLLCFIQAHRQTQASLMELLKETDCSIVEAVVAESEHGITKAEDILESMPKEMTQEVRVEVLINVVLENERRFIVNLVEEGALQEKQAHHLLEAVQHDQKMSHKKRTAAKSSSYVARQTDFSCQLTPMSNVSGENLLSERGGLPRSFDLRGEEAPPETAATGRQERPTDGSERW